MFILGVYFSINVKQEESFNILIAIISDIELYKFIEDNIKSVTGQKEIFYLFGCPKLYKFQYEFKK